MQWQLVQFSSVVVGQTHNPSILNPDFLVTQGIVPKSWGWEVAETVTTMPLALVRYKNAVNITVENNKLQVTDHNVENGPEQSKITEIAKAYVKILKHVHYTAVGNNFQSVMSINNASEAIKRRFLKKGRWNTFPMNLDSVGVQLSYSIKPVGRLTLTLNVVEAKLSENADAQLVIMANANFTRECEKQHAAESAVNHLKQAMEDWNMYKQTINEFFEEQV